MRTVGKNMTHGCHVWACILFLIDRKGGQQEMIDFRQLMRTEAYDFLREDKRLGDRIILLGLGGSYAYGTNNENSDVDFRGITLNLPSDLLGLTVFEQYEDKKTDTVIYAFNKIVKLLLDCNPNTCEILGLDEDRKSVV